MKAQTPRTARPGAIKGRLRWAVLGAALGLFSAVAFNNQTGWIVARQARVLTTMGLSLETDRPATIAANAAANASQLDVQKASLIAATSPNDIPLQIGLASMQSKQSSRPPQPAPDPFSSQPLPNPPNVSQYVALCRRFPASPIAASALITALIPFQIGLDRSEPTCYAGTKYNQNGYYLSEAQARMLRSAAELGAHSDPGNAYFNVVLALADYSLHQDSKALSEMDAASRSAVYNSYDSQIADGVIRLRTQMYGRVPAGWDYAALSASSNIWRDELIQGATGVTVWKAETLERRGDFKGGAALRTCVARIGATESRNRQTDIMGDFGSRIVMASIVVAAPEMAGGYLDNSTATKGDYFMQASDRFGKYLSSHGLDVERVWFSSLLSAYDLRSMQTNYRFSRPPRTPPYRLRLAADAGEDLWLAGDLTLVQVPMLAVIGLALAVRAYWDRFRSHPHPAWDAARWRAAAFGVASVLLGTAYLTIVYRLDNLTYLAVASIAAAVITIVIAGRQRVTTAVTFFQVAAWAILTLNLAGVITTAIHTSTSLTELVAIQEAFPRFTAHVSLHTALFAMSVVLALPAALLYRAAVWSKVRYVPQSVGIPSGLRASILPAISIVLVAYSLCVIQISRCEMRYQSLAATYVNMRGN